jgi:hypothetical protein
MLVLSAAASALKGNGGSAIGALDTVPPALTAVSPVSGQSLAVSFSKPMFAPGVTTPANYTLTWTSGEMRDGEPVTVTVAGVQDAAGNLIDPTANRAQCAGQGVPPVFANLQATPAQAKAGDLVTLTFTASEPLDGDPTVSVNGHEAAFARGGKTTGSRTTTALETRQIRSAPTPAYLESSAVVYIYLTAPHAVRPCVYKAANQRTVWVACASFNPNPCPR